MTLSRNGPGIWLASGCALAVLCIWSSFILIARASAQHALTAFDIAFLRFLSQHVEPR